MKKLKSRSSTTTSTGKNSQKKKGPAVGDENPGTSRRHGVRKPGVECDEELKGRWMLRMVRP